MSKLKYNIFRLSFIGGLFLFLPSCKSQTNNRNSEMKNVDTGNVKERKVSENMYPSLRRKAFAVTPEELNLKPDSNKTIAYGAIMDWNIGQAVITVVAFQTGDASMYVSAGQIYIGGYAHTNVKNAGLAFVSGAQDYLSKAFPTTNISLPQKDRVKFYILTNKGKYGFEETVQNLENKNSEWSKMFDLGNDVITQYRTIIDK